MGFPPEFWGTRIVDEALVAALRDETMGPILEEASRLRGRDGKLLLRIARLIVLGHAKTAHRHPQPHPRARPRLALYFKVAAQGGGPLPHAL